MKRIISFIAILAFAAVGSNWSFKREFYAPIVVFNSSAKGVQSNTQLSCPRPKALGCPVVGNHYAPASISILGPCVGPSAIAGIIPLVVVNSVNAGSAWSFAHVGEKLDGVGSPFITHFYAPPTIIFKSTIGWIMAARNHASPSMIIRVRRLSVGCHVFLADTSARLGLPINHFLPQTRRLFTAITNTIPNSVAIFRSPMKRYDNQPSKPFAG